MPQPTLTEAPILYGAYGLVRDSYPERVGDLEAYLKVIPEAAAYLYLRDHVTDNSERTARMMPPPDVVDMFRQDAEELPTTEFEPALRREEQIGLAAYLWRMLLLGELRGDFYGLTDYSFISYLFRLEAIAGKRNLLEYENILMESMRAFLRADLSQAEARALGERLDGYKINPPHSYESNCPLITKLTTEMFWGGVRILLRLPYTDFMPNLPLLLSSSRGQGRRNGH